MQRKRYRRVLGIVLFLLFAVTTIYSWQTTDMSRSLTRVLAEVDLRSVLSLADLTSDIEESRRFTLRLLLSQHRNEQVSYADTIQECDTAASVKTAQLLAVDTDPPVTKSVNRFLSQWERYQEVRDMIVQLSLEGRSKEALAMNDHRGSMAFAAAVQALKAVNQEVSQRAAGRYGTILRSRNARTIRLQISIVCTLFFAVAFYLLERSQAKVLDRLERSREMERQSREWLNTAQSVGRIGVWEVGLNPDYLKFSPQELELVGLPPDTRTLTIRQCLEMVHPDDRSLVKYTVEGPPEETIEREYRVLRPDGREVWLSAKGRITRDPQTGAVRALGAHTDISVLKRHQQELRIALEKAEAGTRAKTLFLANMSHELRTPLNGISGMATLLTDTKLDAEQRDMLDAILYSSGRLTELVDNILHFSTLEAGQKAQRNGEFNPGELVRHCGAAMAAQARAKNLEFNVLVDDAVNRRALGDAMRIRQVLLNLLCNAVKFTEAGSIALSASLREPGERQELAIEVRDTGIGIPPEIQERIFERFQQGDNSSTRKYAGAGLGLAICKELAQIMGGRIELRSAVGEGSRFTLCVPIELVAEKDAASLETASQIV